MVNRVIRYDNVITDKKDIKEVKKTKEKKTFYIVEKDVTKNNSKKDV